MKTKTVEALLDHITQTLPNSDGTYCVPLAQNYLKTICTILQQARNVENMKQTTWDDIVNFCLEGLSLYADDNEGESSSLWRSYSGAGASRLSGSLGNSANGNSRSRTQNVSRQNAEDILQALSYLVSASNSPLLKSCDKIADTVLRIVGLQGATVSQLQKPGFNVLNTILAATRQDRGCLAKEIAHRALPVICAFWQGKSIAKDEMLSSVRDEMMILLLLTHLHLERCVLDEAADESPELPSNLRDLLEVMTAEYARRSDRDQMQLEDIEVADLGSRLTETAPFQVDTFRLRLHHIRAERNWANLQVMAILERLVSLADQIRGRKAPPADRDADNQSRKRKRIAQTSDRLLTPLKSADLTTRLAGLHVLPFVLHQSQLSEPVLIEVLDQLALCITDKRGTISSWASLAISRYEVQSHSTFC